MTGLADLLDRLTVAVLEAGDAALRIRSAGLAVEKKADASPVTPADREAEALIMKHLAAVAPRVPVIAEESAASGVVPDVDGEFFLVDPIDGTKDYVKGGPDFTVNIGLVRDRVPVAGIVFAPALGRLYLGSVDSGAFARSVTKGTPGEARAIRIRRLGEGAQVDVVASRSHRTAETDAYIARYEVGKLVEAGSSLKFCTVAEGRADLYPRLGRTMQWDTAAGDAVLRAAGGRVLTLAGAPLNYGPNGKAGLPAWENPWFVAVGGAEPLVSA
jgi:3'(2'),5'-bisphosphate nucleotidase